MGGGLLHYNCLDSNLKWLLDLLQVFWDKVQRQVLRFSPNTPKEFFKLNILWLSGLNIGMETRKQVGKRKKRTKKKCPVTRQKKNQKKAVEGVFSTTQRNAILSPWLSVQFSSVAQLCPTLCDPMNRSMPGLPVHHQLLESTQTHVHWVSDAIHISSSAIPFSSCPQSFSASGSFPMSQLFASSGQSIGVSASASVLPMNTQHWSPLGWTGWISLQSRDSQESSPTPQFKSFNSFALSFLYSPTLTSIHDNWKNYSLD